MEKNKIVLGIVAIMLLVMSSIMVVGMDDVLVECGEGWFNSDVCRDFELQDEFDSVTDYINSKEAAWSKDEVGGGIGSSTVYKILGIDKDIVETNIFNYLSTIFTNKAELEKANKRIDVLEAKIYLMTTDQEITPKALKLTTAMIESDRTGEEIVFTWINDKYRCFANKCITVRGVVD